MKNIVLSVLTILTLLTVSCTDDNPVTQTPTVQLNSEVNDFIWKGLNYWYFWQTDVANLADSKDDDIDDYYTYLNGFVDSEDLFNSLLNTSLDDFSWYIPDVQAQLDAFRGTTVSYGIEIPRTVVRVSQGSDDIVIFVAYVVPGSPADLAGIERGDLIYKVDGTVLNTGNLSLLNNIFREPNISLGVANFVNGSLTPKGSDKPLTAVSVTENPVHYSSVIEEGGNKIGYLVYNGFRSTYHSELNDVFATFKSEGINELIVDLRYNGGGSVLTSAYLSSMIEGSKADGSTFASLTYNAKRNADNGVIYPFYDEAALFNKQTGAFENTFVTINRLTNLSRIYVITSDKTASASEMIINGLRPSIEVVTVGTKTVGKNEGSFTVVDAPATSDDEIFTNIDGRNSNHTVGMQPIVFQIFNSLNQSDYADGFEANIMVDEIEYTANILPFGDVNEIMLRTTLDAISGAVTKSSKIAAFKVYSQQKLEKQKFSEEMYILPGENKFQK